MTCPTPEEIEAAKTPSGGWTKEQLAKWGVPWPPPKGWREALMTGHTEQHEAGERQWSASYVRGAQDDLASEIAKLPEDFPNYADRGCLCLSSDWPLQMESFV